MPASTTLYGRDVDENTSFWTLQAGIERKFIPLGKTTIFGEYFHLDRGAGFGSTMAVFSMSSDLGTGLSQVANSQIQGWSIGLNQNLNEVIDLYFDYKHVDLDVTTTDWLRRGKCEPRLDPVLHCRRTDQVLIVEGTPFHPV